MRERKMYSIGFNLKVALITTWTFHLQIFSFLALICGIICLCFENLFCQLQTSQKSELRKVN